MRPKVVVKAWRHVIAEKVQGNYKGFRLPRRVPRINDGGVEGLYDRRLGVISEGLPLEGKVVIRKDFFILGHGEKIEVLKKGVTKGKETGREANSEGMVQGRPLQRDVPSKIITKGGILGHVPIKIGLGVILPIIGQLRWYIVFMT